MTYLIGLVLGAALMWLIMKIREEDQRNPRS